VGAGVTYIIGKQFSFAASHHLDRLPLGHKCARPHGHTYIVQILLANEHLDETGFVTDFADLEPLRRYIDARLDHRDLNEALDIQPSCELLARHLFCWCRDHLAAGHLVVAVRVSESPTTWAEFRPGQAPESLGLDGEAAGP
jgi:6-pyruvoyltetrahydropterin/6-carboxytetrahydropterin synthase